MTYTKLILGTPKFQRKIRYRPIPYSACTHPISYGSILPDGGFEASNGQGPNGNEIPNGPTFQGFPDNFPWLEYSDDSLTGFPANMWWQSVHEQWFVSSTNPRTGSFHARQTLSGATSFPWLHLNSFAVCADRYTGNFWFPGATCSVEPGDSWSLEFYAMASVVTNSNALEVDIVWAPSATDDDDYIEDGLLNQALTTSYAQFQVNGTAPSTATTGFDGPYLMFMRIENKWVTSSGVVTIDLDDVTLTTTAV